MDCGGCKALIHKMNTKYKTCESYCNAIDMCCVNSYEETSDSCVEELRHPCSAIVNGSLKRPSTDVICECISNDIYNCFK